MPSGVPFPRGGRVVPGWLLVALAAVVCLWAGAGPARPATADAALSAGVQAKRAKCAGKRRTRRRCRLRRTTRPPTLRLVDSRLPAPRSAGCAGADDADAATDQTGFAAAVACLVDEVRAGSKLGALTDDARLRRAAAVHVEDMAVNHYFGHDSPAGESNEQRIAAAGYTPGRGGVWLVGENIALASGAVTPRSVVAQWLASPPHLANILSGDFRDTGVAVAPVAPDGTPGVTVAQVFGRRR